MGPWYLNLALSWDESPGLASGSVLCLPQVLPVSFGERSVLSISRTILEHHMVLIEDSLNTGENEVAAYGLVTARVASSSNKKICITVTQETAESLPVEIGVCPLSTAYPSVNRPSHLPPAF